MMHLQNLVCNPMSYFNLKNNTYVQYLSSIQWYMNLFDSKSTHT